MVELATRVFGSPLRAHLVRYYLHHPGATQNDAVEALGSPQRSIATNIGVLVEAKVLLASPSPTDGRATTFTVDEKQLASLKTALDRFTSR